MKLQAIEGKPQPSSHPSGLSALVQLEGMVRSVQTQPELQFLFVNETRRLLSYQQAIFLSPDERMTSAFHARAASSVPMIDRNTPLIQYVERLVAAVRKKRTGLVLITGQDCPPSFQQEWKELHLTYGLWCPLVHPDKTVVGGLWLMRDQPWSDADTTILTRVSEAYAYAWKAVGHDRRRMFRWGLSKTMTWGGVLAALCALAIPVPMSVLAPAKIVAKDPTIVSAPIDGVIADIPVPPNSMVTVGQLLFKYDDTTFRSDYEVAERNLDVAMAQYRRASQGSFIEAQQKAEVPLLKAEAELRDTERDYAYERLMKVEVKAEQQGLVLYTDKSDWIGKPVVVGQRIMEVADPHRVEVRIDLPVDDAMVLHEGAQVKLFLNANPFDTVSATISHASYHAEVLSNNLLAYRVIAQCDQRSDDLRIGWQGTAKIYGDQVTLFTYLFRRPISAVRQWIGL